MEFFDRIYLDKEKDIIVNLYKENDDELTYIIETPNHKTGNLITNLARICNVETEKDENDMKIIKGTIPAEINADILIKATKVNGVYDKDPKKFDDAKKYDEISYIDVLNKQLNVMDSTAISLCMEEKIPILVINILEKNNLKKALIEEKIGTIVK